MSYQSRSSGRMGQLVSWPFEHAVNFITLLLGLIGVMVLYSVAGGDFRPGRGVTRPDWRSV